MATPQASIPHPFPTHFCQREKTLGQIVNEFEEMLAIEKERAKEREKKGGEVSGKGSDNVTQPLDDTGRARDKAAKKINANVSGQTLEKGKEVKDKAESDDEPEEVKEKAQEAWEGLQSGEESFNSAYETVKDAENDVGEDNTDDERTSHDLDVLTSQETDEWSSPREIVEPLDDVLGGFDLDPCSGAEESPFATDTITEDENGLESSWLGDVWVNPPYSDVSSWVDKAISEVQNGNAETITFLCKGDSSTDWWQRAAKGATAIATIDHRLSFGDGENSAPFASHIIVFGNPSIDVIEQLQEYGTVLKRWENG